jgi:ribosomal-protein-alanine N-acetyltransferase
MIETERLVIRPAQMEDAQLLFNLNADPEVIRYTGDSSFKTFLEAQALIREKMMMQFEKYKMGRFMVFLKEGPFLGWCGLKFFPETNEVDLGFRFIKSQWGKGYATESSRAILKYGFQTLQIKRIIAKAMPENVNSIKVMHKLGMNFRGYLHDPTDPQPFILFDMIQKEFER